MPEVVHKYALLSWGGLAEAKMPTRRRILSLQVQDNAVCLWALVDPASPLETVPFACVVTGGAVPEAAGAYVGTAMLDGGTFVLHVFEGRGVPSAMGGPVRAGAVRCGAVTATARPAASPPPTLPGPPSPGG